MFFRVTPINVLNLSHSYPVLRTHIHTYIDTRPGGTPPPPGTHTGDVSSSMDSMSWAGGVVWLGRGVVWCGVVVWAGVVVVALEWANVA